MVEIRGKTATGEAALREPKDFDQLSDKQKIQRLREMVKTMLLTLQNQGNQLDNIANHVHNKDGRAVVEKGLKDVPFQPLDFRSKNYL